MTQFIPAAQLRDWRRALPFWLSLALLPMVWIGAVYGSWWVLIPPLATLALARIVLLTCATVSDRVLRTAFRVISGKHSYRRVPIDRYGRYRERRHIRR